MLLSELVLGKKIISIIGLAKNTGKTVVLNCLINEMKELGKLIGLSSIGHDGEMYDSILTNFRKPRIFVNSGNIIATTDKLLSQCNIEVECLNCTNILTALGEVIICRVLHSGYIELAGPSTVKSMKKICNLMLNYGAETVIVDGSIDRKCIASPDFCDGFIIATGAVLNGNLDNVVSYTQNKVELLSLPEVIGPEIRRTIRSCDKPMIVDSELKPNYIEQITDISNYNQILNKLNKESEYVYFNKSLIENVVDSILKSRKDKIPKLIIEDSTKHFVGINKIRELKRIGGELLVMNPSNLIAVTINPVAPNSHMFEPKLFLDKLRKSLPKIQVINVLDKSYYNSTVCYKKYYDNYICSDDDIIVKGAR